MASNKSKTPGPIQVVVVLMLTVLAFYFGNRFGQVFDFNTMEITDGALATVNSIVAAPAAISMASVPMLYAIGLAITVLIVWLYTFMYGVDLWVNDEGLFNGSKPNRAIYATKHMEEVGYLDQLTFGHPVKEGELYSLRR